VAEKISAAKEGPMPEPDKINQIRMRLAQKGVFLVEADLLAHAEHLGSIPSDDALARAAERIISRGYSLG
jgi:hypothetical protein